MSGRIDLKSVRLKTAQKYSNWLLFYLFFQKQAPFSVLSGVPGGAVMAALGPLASVLGFNADMQALMIALYIAMDSFGTACNVTGDGAIAVVVDKIFRKDQ